MNSWWQQVYFGNTVMAYFLATLSLLLGWIVVRIIKWIFLKQIDKFTRGTRNIYDDLFSDVIEKFVIPWLYILVPYLASQELNLHPRLDKILDGAMVIVTIYFVVRMVNYTIQYLITSSMRRRGESEGRIRHLSGMLIVVKGFVWFLGLLTMARNFGFDITTLLASLGVGGIAIALASQAILGDLFSYLVIFFDKPFEIGDFVNLNNDVMGTVEYIGIKTTRLRSLSGEQLVVSNTNMTNATIRNFKRMEQRRVVFRLAVLYQTPYELLQRIPTMLKEIVTEQEGIVFDRAHLLEYGSYSINFEVVYIVTSPEFNLFMDIQQRILFRIHEEFSKSGIEFAIPTQTVLIEGLQREENAKNKDSRMREQSERLPANR